ncbi:Serine/threonine-protein kinase [Trichoderma virens FT-333]|nr:Serine/threonine-protein kinase [Trichoderma virens FT-333]
MASRQDSSSLGSRRSGGRNVGQFAIDKEIGKGSFAQVYMGWHKETKAAVAIKSVELDRLNKKLKENLYGEIQILKTLRHPHIVALHDCLESATHINLVMEYCELGDLSLFIKKRDKLITHPATHDMARKYPSAPDSGLHEVVIRHFLKQLASALEFLRSKNYVHRDVKPQNLLLLPSQAFREKRNLPIMEASQDSLIPMSGIASLPMLKLADFGFARVLPSTSLADTLCGSPLYMAPEILRYERYDAKADLWSVEAAEDVIKFPKEVTITSEMKSLVRSLLKRSPVERLSFENFFSHPIVVNEIPGLVEDDIPRPARREPRTISQGEATVPSPRIGSLRNGGFEPAPARSSREQLPRSSPLMESPSEGRHRPPSGEIHRRSNSPRETGAAGLGIQRPTVPHAASLPNHPRVSKPSLHNTSPPSSLSQDIRKARIPSGKALTDEEEKAAQDVMFERDYVVVERRHVEVNALADELAANEKLASQSPTSLKSKPLVRHFSQQGPPNSTTGAVAAPASRTQLVTQGRAVQDRRSSYEKALSASPGSASSAITKAIQDASLRLFGVRVPIRPKGQSPPMYQPFPAYPTPPTSAGLIGDGKNIESEDEDVRSAQAIEDFATRSDCVYGFAEVKYKQLVPMAPSTNHGLGGVAADQMSVDDEGLTAEAVVALSEEALVLYVKSLSLLARAMDIASIWWSKKSKGDVTTGLSAVVSQSVVQRINAVVQWVRQRFNEVLEKSEVVRLKLIDAQKQLPEDHPSHPSNQGVDSIMSSAGSGMDQVYLTPGITAEKLMYDRALEMSRAAAIDEVTNENLPGCEISYITAIRMLEAVLDSGDDAGLARTKESCSDLESDEEAHIRKMITMISGRLSMVRKKQRMIAEANSKTQSLNRRRSGDVTPRSPLSQAST